MKRWKKGEIIFLEDNYPNKGLKWCAKKLDRPLPSVRQKASNLKLKQNRKSQFFKDWQKKAATSKIGKKRPLHALKMKSVMKGKKHSEESIKKMAISGKEKIKKYGHPRGMLGKKHSIEARKKFSEITTKRWQNMSDEKKQAKTKKMIHTKFLKGNYANYRIMCTWKAAWREIGGKKKFFRSRWEANYARYLEWLKQNNQIKEWEHEAQLFWFEKIKRGCTSYLPDFRITNLNDSIEFHEVKGWMDNRSKTKIKRMKKYYPEIKLIIIESKMYNSIKKQMQLIITEWE